MLHQAITAIHKQEGACILAGLVRRFGDLDLAEDALQEAYARALKSWPIDGMPEVPAAWISTVARNHILDKLRTRSREAPTDPAEVDVIADLSISASAHFVDATSEADSSEHDLLGLLFACCHPALASSAQMALALKCLCRLSTAEIARAFVESESTTAQKLVRAKRKIAQARIPFSIPAAHEREPRLATVLGTIYLLFNEGFTATRHARLGRPDLMHEAIRLAKMLSDLMRDEPEVLGLHALLLLHAARLPAREDESGMLIPLEDQDRCLWLEANIRQGKALLDLAIARRRRGPYQIQAAIAALHADAPHAKDTDWLQIHALYGALIQFTDTPVIRLNAAVAQYMAGDLAGAATALQRLATTGDLESYPLLHVALADLARRQNKLNAAVGHFQRALSLTHNESERRFLTRRLDDVQFQLEKPDKDSTPDM